MKRIERDELKIVKLTKLAQELQKIDPEEEVRLAEEWIEGEAELWCEEW